MTTIIFENDSRVQQNKSVKKYVEKQPSSYTKVFLEEEMFFIIKGVDEPTYEKIRMTAGEISRELMRQNTSKAKLRLHDLVTYFSSLNASKVTTAFVEGWNLGTYQFIPYKTNAKNVIPKLMIIEGEDWKTSVDLGMKRAEATALSRELMNEIPSKLNPDTFPTILTEIFINSNVEVKISNRKALEKMKMNGLLAVCRGSKYDPSFVELTYKGDDSKPLVALVGKGVTFDTGGISLKKGKDISSMRMDMGGAAAVTGAVKLLADMKAKVNVVALIPIAENMPDRHSVLPGEVIHYRNGHTVQVGNTDAEGRLILADGLIRSGELGADYVVDIATLTGSILNALGTKRAGVFGDEKLATIMKEIGDENGEFNWPMPLVDEYDSYLASDYADFSNTSSKAYAGSITASLFLRRFVPATSRWLHVDIAGVMMGEEEGYYSKAATGFGVRLLADYTLYVSK